MSNSNIIINKELAEKLGYDSISDLMIAVREWLYYNRHKPYLGAWSMQEIMRKFIKDVHEKSVMEMGQK